MSKGVLEKRGATYAIAIAHSPDSLDQGTRVVPPSSDERMKGPRLSLLRGEPHDWCFGTQ